MRYLPHAREVGLVASDEPRFDPTAAVAKKPRKQPTIKQHPFCKSGFSEVGHLASMVR